MRNLAIVAAMLLGSTMVKAADFDVKGFIVIDALSFEKQKEKNEEINAEIITLDLKFYFRHENWSAKLKLDLDGSIAEDNQEIYEEANVTYRHSNNVRITAGKGKVPFHQMHFGAARPSFIDGGSILFSSNSWRDQDNKILLGVQLGSYRSGWINEFTFWGNANNPKVDRVTEGPYFGKYSDGTIEYETGKTLETKKQRGFANKFTYTPAYGVKYSVAGNYYWRDIDPKADWALDLAMTDSNDEREYWFEYMWGFTSKHPNDKYTAKKQWEHYIQAGYEYRLTETFSLALSGEAVLVKKLNHDKNDYNGANESADGGYGQSRYNNGQVAKTNNYMLETAAKWRLAKSVDFKLGLTYERKYIWEARNPSSKNQTASDKEYLYKGFQWAYQLAAGISFWF
ncbi:hypothetical protein [Bacteriovorax sp. BSW11_IV]|uniref:hypothetical protein n=1 Tax=Bacteriovorax sp. BSW11_IV TaxID=1353529 RepID=UPI0005540C32|nr:hypothetical protein [Bacteriovorax sp. BSW11_IV]